MTSIAHDTARRLARLVRSCASAGLAALLGIAASSGAQAQIQSAPTEWSGTSWSGSTCASCHGNPLQMSADGRASPALYPLGTSNLSGVPTSDVTAFATWFANTAVPTSGNEPPMVTFSSSGSTAQKTAIWNYLLAIRDGSVTPTSIGFGRVTVGQQPTLMITIANPRLLSIKYGTQTIASNTDFSLASESCGTRIVPGGGTCTITVRYSPSGSSPESATLTLPFVASGSDPTPPTRFIGLSGNANAVPVANAGTAQNVATGATVTLHGSATDANAGDTLTYSWSLARPAGSAAALSSTTSTTPTFVADVAGVYTATLTANDGLATSSAATVTITATVANVAPVAVASTTQANVFTGATVTVDGSGSSDANNDALTYAWTLTAKPAGSAAALSSSTAIKPTFVADRAGTYTARLVVNDGQVNSAPATVTVTATVLNVAPVANAGPPQSVVTGAVVTLDGTGSSDANGDALTYAWTLTGKPAGSGATLVGPTAAKPHFTADLPGTYSASLVVNDGQLNSAPATVGITVTNGNAPPIANAGPAQLVPTGSAVTLDGSGSSDADSDPLTYAWTLTTKPAGSTATLANPTAVHPSFVADLTGTYVASLLVNDGHVNSGAATVTITAQVVAPTFSLSTTSLPFNAALSSTATASALVTNGGNAPLVLQSLSFGGASVTDYSLDASNGCTASLSIAPAATCTLVVRFAPTATGVRNATLTIAHNAAGSPQAITLLGTGTPGPQGQLALSASTLGFPAAVVGTPSTTSITVLNTGNAATIFTAFVLSGSAAADFARGGTCALTTSLAAGASCTFDITFTPSAAGARNASFELQSDATNPVIDIALTGSGLAVPAPALGLSTTTLDFGTQTIAGLYPARTLTLTNTGTANLAIGGIAESGTAFTLTSAGTCVGTLVPGATCDLAVTFAPTAVATVYTGTLAISSNASASPALVALQGSGSTNAVPVLVWSPVASTLAFGQVLVGSASAVQSITVLNQGPGGAVLSVLNAVGADASAFSVTAGTCAVGATLFEGQTCRIDVRFAPPTSGARSATLQFASTGSAPSSLSLTGTGLGGAALAFAMSTAQTSFGEIMVGAQSTPSTITLSNTGTVTAQVMAIAVDGPYAYQAKTCPPPPFTLASGSECTITVTFLPTATGTATGTLQVTTDARATPAGVALDGEGSKAPSLSNGGCSISRGETLLDPTLGLLALAAIAALVARSRADARSREPRR